MSQPSSKKRASVGVLFWIACILLILVIFLANRTNIQDVLQSTGLVNVVRDRFGGRNDESPETQIDAPAPANDSEPSDRGPGVEYIGPDADATSPDTPEGQRAEDPATRETADDTVDSPSASPPSTEPSASRDPNVVQRAPSPNPDKPNRLMAGLYYIKVTDEGRTYPQKVVRPVFYASSPLTETINALIEGPSGNELEDGLLNLIPPGTRLISAHVTNGVAYLNFSQNFRYNQLGAEGMVGQLQQIIYSSTEFPTVSKVQFMVEGETLDYLGGEGIFIGEPLGRDAFS
ncbi:MAG: hypothetical protein E4H09_03800 [Spirochaetales bacterium]|nr:MAG: hypothetical protein E4H09_03800 [Spirochaetales bacterium]